MRILKLFAAIPTMAAMMLTGCSGPPTASAAVPAVSMTGLHVVMGTGGHAGHITNAAGQVVQLRGVDVSGSEYNCVQGAGFNSPVDQAGLDVIKHWGLNAIRVPLNEDCWLGINGANPGGSAYQAALLRYVNLITSNNMAAVLDLHWIAPGNQLANSSNNQRPMADADHAVKFWSQVAAAYKSNGAVVFDLFNEPDINAGNADASWACWLRGGDAGANCAKDGGGKPYAVAGMAQMLQAVRNAGAENVVLLEGLGDAHDFKQWLARVNSIPSLEAPLNGLSLSNVAASWHIYSQDSLQNLCPTQFNAYQASLTCTDGRTTAQNSGITDILAAGHTVVIGEIGLNVSPGATYSSVTTPTLHVVQLWQGWLESLLSWMDSEQQGYIAWNWKPGGEAPPTLISTSAGAPTPYFGTTYESHLAVLNGIPVITGVCGSASSTAVSRAPSTDLCSSGPSGPVTGAGPWNWSCAGSNGGATAYCEAASTAEARGACGPVNGKTLTSAPGGSSLCASGRASRLAGSGPWTWSCNGEHGGSNALCAAASRTAGSTQWVFHQGKLNWTGGAWGGTPTYGDTSQGASDIAFTLTEAWGGWQPHVSNECYNKKPGACFDTSRFQFITVALRPTREGQRWSISLTTSSGQNKLVQITTAAYGPASPTVGQWNVYRVPIADFGLASEDAAISQLSVQDQTGAAMNKWYIDNVGFTLAQ